MSSKLTPRFEEMLSRFFYSADEDEGPYLASAPSPGGDSAPSYEETPEEFLSFTLEGETYAVPIHAVREILKVTAVTEIPRAKKNVLGLINVRGEMLPLYDIKTRLLLRDAPQAVHTKADVPREARVVLLKELEGDAGVLVDQVNGVVKLLLSKLEEAPELGVERSAIAGIARKGEQLFILLDVEQALA